MTERWWASVSGADRARRPASVVVIITADEEQGGFVVRAYDNEGRSTVPRHGTVASKPHGHGPPAITSRPT